MLFAFARFTPVLEWVTINGELSQSIFKLKQCVFTVTEIKLLEEVSKTDIDRQIKTPYTEAKKRRNKSERELQ